MAHGLLPHLGVGQEEAVIDYVDTSTDIRALRLRFHVLADDIAARRHARVIRRCLYVLAVFAFAAGYLGGLW